MKDNDFSGGWYQDLLAQEATGIGAKARHGETLGGSNLEIEVLLQVNIS